MVYRPVAWLMGITTSEYSDTEKNYGVEKGSDKQTQETCTIMPTMNLLRGLANLRNNH
jgi:hypothetical protein